MDKRTLIAFVLSAVVLFGYMAFFGPKTEDEKPTSVKRPTTKAAQPTPGVKPAPTKPAPTTAKPAKPAKPAPAPKVVTTKGRAIKVDHPLYAAVFSENGARLLSFRLKKYFTGLNSEAGPVSVWRTTKVVNQAGLKYLATAQGARYYIDVGDNKYFVEAEGDKYFVRLSGVKYPLTVRNNKYFVRIKPDQYYVGYGGKKYPVIGQDGAFFVQIKVGGYPVLAEDNRKFTRFDPTRRYFIEVAKKGRAKPTRVYLKVDKQGYFVQADARHMVEMVTSSAPYPSPLTTSLPVGVSPAVQAKALYKASLAKVDVHGMAAALIFTWDAPGGVKVVRTYTFYPDTYRIKCDVSVVNSGTKTFVGSPQIALFNRASQTASAYAVVGLLALKGGSLINIDTPDIGPRKVLAVKGKLRWAAFADTYFMSAVAPLKKAETAAAGSVLLAGNVVRTVYEGPQIVIKPGVGTKLSYMLYFGPRRIADLKAVNMAGSTEFSLKKAVDFGRLDIVAKPLLWVMNVCYSFIPNYGMAIIILSILINILFWPLNRKSKLSMKRMAALQPQMKELRAQYKDDKQRLNQEMMALYKTNKVNPMGGCFPMLLQIPVLFAMFAFLYSAIELRHAPFILWVTDLSAPDRLFNFAFSIPLMQPPSGIPVLTLLMGASMFLQQKMTPTTGDATQAKIMLILPVVFTVLFINFPSGLVLYWLINNLISIGQQQLMSGKGFKIRKKAA